MSKFKIGDKVCLNNLGKSEFIYTVGVGGIIMTVCLADANKFGIKWLKSEHPSFTYYLTDTCKDGIWEEYLKLVEKQ